MPQYKEELPPQCPEGAWPMVLVDFEDLGMVESTFQGRTTTKRKVRFTFEAPVKGKNWWISRTCSLALGGENAVLPKILSAFGISIADAKKGWDSDHLLGSTVIGVVKHSDEGWANIENFLKTDQSLSASGTYKRREKKQDQPS